MCQDNGLPPMPACKSLGQSHCWPAESGWLPHQVWQATRKVGLVQGTQRLAQRLLRRMSRLQGRPKRFVAVCYAVLCSLRAAAAVKHGRERVAGPMYDACQRLEWEGYWASSGVCPGLRCTACGDT
jgi:hypothetical protein